LLEDAKPDPEANAPLEDAKFDPEAKPDPSEANALLPEDAKFDPEANAPLEDAKFDPEAKPDPSGEANAPLLEDAKFDPEANAPLLEDAKPDPSVEANAPSAALVPSAGKAAPGADDPRRMTAVGAAAGANTATSLRGASCERGVELPAAD